MRRWCLVLGLLLLWGCSAPAPPLLHVSWPACPRTYPDNLFAWFDPAAGRMVTDRKPGGSMGPCGVYEYLGDGAFRSAFRHEEFHYISQVRWTDGGMANESTVVELLHVQLERLPVVLSMLADTEVVNPERLFEPAELYRQFRLKVRPDSRFELHGAPSADTIVVDIAHGGTLTATYRVQGELKQNVLITGLKWAP